MKTMTHRLLLIGIVAIMYCSCNKSESDKTSLQRPAHGIQIFKVNAKSGGTVTLDRGEPAIFPAGVFVNTLNQPVSGVVDIQLQEIYSGASLSSIDTSKVNYRIVASNEFYMKATATQNGLPLHIIQGTTYSAAMPFDTIFGE